MSEVKKIPCSRKKLLSIGKKMGKIILQFLVQFTPKGINQQFYDTLNDEVENVSNMKTDKQLEKEMTAQVAIVYTTCAACYKWGMKLKRYLKRAFGLKGMELNEFPASFDDLRFDPQGIINNMPLLFVLAEKYKTAMLTKAMDADFIDKGKAMFAELDTQNTLKLKMEDDNKSYCVARNMAQYALYEKINYINSVGRELFENDPVNKKYFESPWTVKGNGNEDDDKEEKTVNVNSTTTGAGTAPAK
jgi:hypothetical protein